MNPFVIFLLFIKYSALCFGGGYVLIPLLNADLVGAPPKLLTPELFARYISIAQVTPGPVFINVATFVGYLQSGFFGALGASYFAKHWKLVPLPVIVGVIVLIFSPTMGVGTLMFVTIVAAVLGAFVMVKKNWL